MTKVFPNDVVNMVMIDYPNSETTLDLYSRVHFTHVGAVRHHILDCHVQISYPLRYGIDFQDDPTNSQQDAHKSHGEVISDTVRPSKLTAEQRTSLRSTIVHEHEYSVDNKWYEIWHIIFPDTTSPPSPYVGDNVQEYETGPTGLTTLYVPPEDKQVVTDLIFVHGLGGGSRRTWTKDSPSTFWPGEWLPQDEAFRDIRIHTFGYDIFSQTLPHSIPDLANSLLCSIQDAPLIPRDIKTPLVLIGHNMGGLVIQAAYVQAQQKYETMCKRISALIFLGTPHTIISPACLQHALTFSEPTNQLVLHSGRYFNRGTNKHFLELAHDVKLYSYYETIPTLIRGRYEFIVEKDAAILGLQNEMVMFLKTDHRGLSRFETVHDPSYISIRNTLATIVEEATNSQRLDLLEKPPRTLEEAYIRTIFEKIKNYGEEMQRAICKILQWTNLQYEYLPAEVLCVAASVIDGDKRLSEDDIVDSAEISRACQGLISRTPVGDRFVFSHVSVKQFLQHLDPCDEALGCFHLNDEEARISLTKAAILFLSQLYRDELATVASEGRNWGEENPMERFRLFSAKIILDSDQLLDIMATQSTRTLPLEIIRQYARMICMASQSATGNGGDIKSVISAVFSHNLLWSSRSSAYTDVEVLAIMQLVDLLQHDDEMASLYPQAISTLGNHRGADVNDEEEGDFSDSSHLIDYDNIRSIHIVQNFLVSSEAYSILRRNFRQWLKIEEDKDSHDGESAEVNMLDIEYDAFVSLQIKSRIINMFKMMIERFVGCKLSWWPLPQPESDLDTGYTRVYSTSLGGIQFYDDISTPLAMSLFPKLANVHSPKTDVWMKGWGREVVQLSRTTLATILVKTFASNVTSTPTAQVNITPLVQPGSRNTASVSNVQRQTPNQPTSSANHNQLSTNTQTTPPGNNPLAKPDPILLISAELKRNTYRARWYGWKRPIGVRFYRFDSFLFKNSLNLHYISVHRDQERYPEQSDPEYSEYEYQPRPWPAGAPYPSNEVWHYFENPVDCGTSSCLSKILPVRIAGGIASRGRAFGIHIEEAYSIWAILIPSCIVVLATLAATLWFIPQWLRSHPDDLQNATVPIAVVFTVIGSLLQIIVSLVVFRWALT
ncbi:hypothetical protein E0Z10_g353 [Xylaria hypoxylon]|uniref:GPI inositol-deacylase n=1 Tax=Xylaria hypoxylon TaxID=37992 RepID=A0A4Z0ZBT5_9PEZI|nr:hypothetical protein E0Z10_g353 [Xylaria hypoxylon]